MLCKLFWYTVFCPLKIKITQFRDGFRLKTLKFRALLFVRESGVLYTR